MGYFLFSLSYNKIERLISDNFFSFKSTYFTFFRRIDELNYKNGIIFINIILPLPVFYTMDGVGIFPISTQLTG